MTTYNGARFVKEQMESIISQMLPGDELIISDDNSTDNTLAIISSYKSDVVKIYTNNFRNAVQNFEFVISKSQNPIICLSDQDDIWKPNKLELIRSNLKNSRLSCLLLNGDIIDADGTFTGETIFEKWRSRPGFWPNLLRNTYMGSSMAFTADLKPYILPLPLNLAMHDWWIGLIAEKIGTVKLISETTINYRIHGSNASLGGSSISQKIKWRFNIWQALQKRLKEKHA